jgi:hypothetical protein
VFGIVACILTKFFMMTPSEASGRSAFAFANTCWPFRQRACVPRAERESDDGDKYQGAQQQLFDHGSTPEGARRRSVRRLAH